MGTEDFPLRAIAALFICEVDKAYREGEKQGKNRQKMDQMFTDAVGLGKQLELCQAEKVQLSKKVQELEELLRKDHDHFRQISEKWDKFLRDAIPEHELIAERFNGGPKPTTPQLSDMYPMTNKQFQEWKESYLKQYRELEKLRCEVAKLKGSEGKAGGQ